MFYLRFTNTAQEDLEKGTSLHFSSYKSSDIRRDEIVELFGCDEDDVVNVDGYWCQVLPGLCGYELEASTLSEALEEIENMKSHGSFKDCFCWSTDSYCIMSGEHVENCPEGEIFYPSEVLHIFKAANDQAVIEENDPLKAHIEAEEWRKNFCEMCGIEFIPQEFNA